MNSQPHPKPHPKPHSPADVPRGALACVTGRFQPLHDQHLELFEIALTHCEHLIIAITNPDPGARQAETELGPSPYRCGQSVYLLRASPADQACN